MTEKTPLLGENPRKKFFIKEENLRNFSTTQKNYSSEPNWQYFQKHLLQQNTLKNVPAVQYSMLYLHTCRYGLYFSITRVAIQICQFCTFLLP